ncbi:MAG: thioredoxin family protein [Acidimicrobiales bacterium]
MDRLLLIVGALTIAGAMAAMAARRRPDPPSAPRHEAPTQLDRADFVRPHSPWLIAVFTSTTCSTCAGVWDRTRPVESPGVAVQEIAVEDEPALHRRYGITAVPTLVLADSVGVVRHSCLGPVTSADLWAAIAAARGST